MNPNSKLTKQLNEYVFSVDDKSLVKTEISKSDTPLSLPTKIVSKNIKERDIIIQKTNVKYDSSTEYTYIVDYKPFDLKLTTSAIKKQVAYCVEKIKQQYIKQLESNKYNTKQHKCIFLIGHPGSGKSVYGKYIIEEHIKNGLLRPENTYETFLRLDPDIVLSVLPVYKKYVILDQDEATKTITINRALIENRIIRKIMRDVNDILYDFIVSNGYNFIYETLWRDRDWYNKIYSEIGMKYKYNDETGGLIIMNLLKTETVEDAIYGITQRISNTGRFIDEEFVKSMWELSTKYMNADILLGDVQEMFDNNKIKEMPLQVNNIVISTKKDEYILHINERYIDEPKITSHEHDIDMKLSPKKQSVIKTDKTLLDTLKTDISKDMNKLMFDSVFRTKPKSIFHNTNTYIKHRNYKDFVQIHNGTERVLHYTYPIQNEVDHITEDIDIQSEYGFINGETKLHMMVYTYHLNDTLYPYLEYFMAKTSPKLKKMKDILCFPNIKYTEDSSVLTQCSKYLSKLLLKESGDRYSESEIHDNYVGIKELKGNNYMLFFYIPNRAPDMDMISRQQKVGWWTTIDEIVNERHSVNFPVLKSFYTFFQSNPTFCNLLQLDIDTKKAFIMDTPKVVYHGTTKEIIPKIQTFGMRYASVNPMLGPYYYFGLFRKAIRYACWTSDRKERKDDDGNIIADKNGKYFDVGGIIRFCIFPKNMKALLNHPLDAKDKSDEYKTKIKGATQDTIDYENSILRLHDHTGKWAESGEEYDSIYVGRAKLENGDTFMTNPEFVVKDYDNVSYMSCYHVDSKTIPDKWNARSNEYMIK